MKHGDRSIVELLGLLREYIVDEWDFCGMCTSVSEMFDIGWISGYEEYRLEKYLDTNAPIGATGYWFPNREKQPRLDWIDKQLEIEINKH